MGSVDEDGKIVDWFVSEGDTIAKGDDVVDIETDKIAGTLESPVEGPLRRIVAEPGSDLPVGAVLAVVAAADVPDAEIEAVVEEAKAAVESGALEAGDEPEPQLVEVGGRTISYLSLGPEDADDPVIFAEHKMLYDTAADVPEESYAIPFGEANVLREGGDVTIVAIGRMVHTALEAAGELAGSGVQAEVIDPRTTSPLDVDTILESVENTGRLVVVDESNPRCSLATDIAATVAQDAFGSLRAPIQLVTGPHTPVPFADALEDLFIPDAAKIAGAVKTAVDYAR